MLRSIPAAFVLALTLGSALTADAQWFSTPQSEHSAWHRYWAGWRENNDWPKQWVGYDRAAVCTPLDTMTQKGWHRSNLIGSFHFDPATNELTAAGQHKVRYILTRQLPDRRIVFVERGLSANETAARVDAVQQVAVRILPAGELPEVADTNMVMEGTPATDVDATLRGFDATRPTPRLPAASSEASNIGENSP